MLNAKSHRRLTHSRRGAAAVEFALLMPLLGLFFVGVVDVAKAAILNQQVFNAARAISVMASEIAVKPDLTTSLTVDQVQQALSAIYGEIPWIRSGLENGPRSATVSSVTFVQLDPTCTPSPTVTCVSQPTVAWSVSYQSPNATGFTNTVRSCGTLTQTSSAVGLAGDLTKLRTSGVANPDPILLVDVYYR